MEGGRVTDAAICKPGSAAEFNEMPRGSGAFSIRVLMIAPCPILESLFDSRVGDHKRRS